MGKKSYHKRIGKFRNILFFTKKQVDLKQKVEKDYIQNGVGIIPCHVRRYSDIVNSYSVKGYETVSPGFVEYVESTVAFIPPEYPIIIRIIGMDFTEAQQKTIRSTIQEDFLYNLGMVQANDRRQKIMVVLMGIGMVVFGILLTYLGGLEALPLEFIYIMFWFFADIFISYVFFDGRETYKKRVAAGRLANAEISFSKSGKGGDTVTKKEAEALYNEMFPEK